MGDSQTENNPQAKGTMRADEGSTHNTGHVKAGHGLPFIPAWLDDLRLDAFQFLVYAHVARRAGGKGTCTESLPNMAAFLKLDDKTVRSRLQSLVALGLLGNEYVAGKGARYWLLPNPSRQTADKGSPLLKVLPEGSPLKGSGAKTPPASRKKLPEPDDAWLNGLATAPAYLGIDVRREFSKMLLWCEVKSKKPSRGRFLNWINKIELPMRPAMPAQPATQQLPLTPHDPNDRKRI